MLLEMLNDLAKEIKGKYDTIDCGGCCVAAAQVAKYLQNIVPTRIVAGNSWKGRNDIDEIRDFVHAAERNSKRAWERNGVDFGHVLIEFEFEGKTYAFDCSHGAVPAEEMWRDLPWTRLDGSFEQQEAEAFANEESWNSMFNRRHVPDVRRRITRFFLANFPNGEALGFKG